MKRNNVIFELILTIIIAVSCNQQANSGYTIEATIEGLEDGTEVCLLDWMEGRTFNYSVVENGTATFQGTFEAPVKAMSFYVKDYSGIIKLVFAPTDHLIVTAKATFGEYEQSGRKYCEFTDVVVTGSELFNVFTEKMKPREEAEKVYRVSPDSIRPKIITKAISEILAANSDDWWGPFMMFNNYAYFTPTPDMRNQFDAMSKEAQESYYGKLVYKKIYPNGRIGDALEEFTLKDDKNNDVTLTQLRKGKKVILIDFWASWCHWCRKEIPNMKECYELYHDKGFEIVSISTDKSEQDWKKALDAEQMPWPNFRDTLVPIQYEVNSLPRIVIADENGRLIGENWRGEELKAKLDSLFTK